MPPSEQWYHDLQQELTSLRRQVEELQDRAPVPCVPSQVRLAQTVEKSGTTYPKASTGADTFWIVFLDGTFTEAQGNQTATLQTCQPTGSPLYVAHSKDGWYYPEGSQVWVEWQNGRWWILCYSPLMVWFFELDEDLPQWDWAPGGTFTPRQAWKKDWDPSANDGKGGFVVDCECPFTVCDAGLAGCFGDKGANGWAEIRQNETEDGFIGVIRGLNCPDECVCGTDWTEMPSCAVVGAFRIPQSQVPTFVPPPLPRTQTRRRVPK